jgi:transketolase
VVALELIPREEFDRVRTAGADADATLGLLADMCRANALVAVKRAGSGHLGSSFSALDVFAELLFRELNVAELGWEHPDRDVFFSSKGHDVPGLYAVLHALGVIPAERLVRLRRLGGLDGHPDVGVPGIEANSGSLGMGISKGRGIAWAKRQLGRGGRVVVMTGDGELQEGQNWEALQGAAHQRLRDLWIVVDRNELQSDKLTEEIVALGDVEAKLRAFGWRVANCDGHDHAALRAAFASFRDVDDERPKALVAHTIKGKGVSFMEHPAALREGGGTYRWHAGAPDDDAFTRTPSSWSESDSGWPRSAWSRCGSNRPKTRPPSPPSRSSASPNPAWALRRPRRESPTNTSPPRTETPCSSSPSVSRDSSCSTPTSRPIAACAASSSRIPTAS